MSSEKPKTPDATRDLRIIEEAKTLIGFANQEIPDITRIALPGQKDEADQRFWALHNKIFKKQYSIDELCRGAGNPVWGDDANAILVAAQECRIALAVAKGSLCSIYGKIHSLHESPKGR